MNIVRHAKAVRVDIQLRVKPTHLQLAICDDGLGFDTSANSSGLGLANIQQRATRLNADLHINSDFGEGTTITLTCPLGIEKPITVK